MKQLTCEMCGSTNVVKQSDMFVCQDCGTKYSVEEARKLMSDSTDDMPAASGPVAVKVDASDELSNLYQLARRAREDLNSEDAARYYDMILIKDPTSWEAYFYRVYYKAMECKIAEIRSAAISVSNCIDTVLKLIKDHVSDREEQEKAVKEVAVRCESISTLLFNAAENHYNGIDPSIRNQYSQERLDNCCAARDIMYTLGDHIDAIFGDNENLHATAADAWDDGLSKHNSLMRYFAKKEQNKAIILSYVDKIKKYYSSYVAPEIDTSSSGCYVATAVYGSYDCPQVWTLRRYRDNTLAETWYGRLFIHLYYAVSPILVKWFGQTDWFRNMWKPRLDRMVARLNEEGVEDTPYQDRNW